MGVFGGPRDSSSKSLVYMTSWKMKWMICFSIEKTHPYDQNGINERRFSWTTAMVLMDTGADMLTLKRQGKWKSDTVAAGYILDSKARKTKYPQ